MIHMDFFDSMLNGNSLEGQIEPLSEDEFPQFYHMALCCAQELAWHWYNNQMGMESLPIRSLRFDYYADRACMTYEVPDGLDLRSPAIKKELSFARSWEDKKFKTINDVFGADLFDSVELEADGWVTLYKGSDTYKLHYVDHKIYMLGA